MSQAPMTLNDSIALVPQLTTRQREVLICIGMGLSTREIAAKLFRSPKAVEGHTQALIRIFGGRRVHLARIAIAAGLTDIRAIQPTAIENQDPLSCAT
jgi:DNA-binding CsgD family transcriptional regulator